MDLSADVLECTSDSTFAVAIQYTSENTPNNNIDVYFNDQYLGFFNGENLPVIVSNVPEGDGTGVITVCASDQNDCCDEVVVELMLCEDPGCNINELFTEPGACTSDSTYQLDFTFNHHNLPTDSIIVTANGTYIGTYVIDPEFNGIEHFPVLESDTVHFVICAGTIFCVSAIQLVGICPRH